MSSTHPSLAAWCKGKTRLLVMNRSDQVSESDRRLWHTHLRKQYDHVCWTNGVTGEGIQQVGCAARLKLGRVGHLSTSLSEACCCTTVS